MSDYNTTRAAVEAAEAIIREKLREGVPNADTGEGSVAGDILVDGHSVLFQFLRDQIEIVRDRQSLLRLQNLPENEGVNDAADALLANFFRFRAQGRFAKGRATLLFSQRADVLVLRNARFIKRAGLVFYLDSATDLFIPASELRPVLDGNGQVQAYATTVFLSAARTGQDYNIEPGPFAGFDRFSSLLMSVRNDEPFLYGSGVETTADFVAGSPSAIALRAMVNARSNDSTLLNQFDTIVQSTTTIGYGDPEMVRDRLRAHGQFGGELHVGGHMDIYLRQPIREAVDRFAVGALTPRNDGRTLILRHLGTTPSGSFVAAGVKVGHVLRIDDGLPQTPAQFRIVGVRPTEIEIAADVPFATATDEIAVAVTLSYSVGTNFPRFDNVIGATSSVNAQTSKAFSQPNRVQLPPLPVQRIKRVELVAPFPPDLLPFADPTTGSVIFTTQKNQPTLGTPALGSELGFFLENLTPELANSDKAVVMLEVGWPAVDLTNATLEVTYDTPYGFADVAAYVNDANTRNSNSNTLARALHPIYLYASVPYRQRTTPLSALSTEVPVFDEVGAQAALQSWVTSYREAEPLDVSLLATKVREASTGAASIYAFKVFYTLPMPDGRLAQYETSDTITLFPDPLRNTAKLLNPTDFGLPVTGYETELRAMLARAGLSDRVTRYIASSSAFVFERRS